MTEAEKTLLQTIYNGLPLTNDLLLALWQVPDDQIITNTAKAVIGAIYYAVEVNNTTPLEHIAKFNMLEQFESELSFDLQDTPNMLD